jgi:hypothetical protein
MRQFALPNEAGGRAEACGYRADRRDVESREIGLWLVDQRSQQSHRLVEARRLAVIGLQRAHKVSPPGLPIVNFGGEDRLAQRQPLEGARDPPRLALDIKSNAIHPGTHAAGAGARIVDLVKKDEDVGAADLVEIAEPRKEIRLMDGDKAAHCTSQLRIEKGFKGGETSFNP